MSKSHESRTKKHPTLNLFAGGIAGLVESSTCHPLDTIKTRMQLRNFQKSSEGFRSRNALNDPVTSTVRDLGIHRPRNISEQNILTLQRGASTSTSNKIIHSAGPKGSQMTAGFIGTARGIIVNEGYFSLYKGLTAVYAGIIPKMAIRFFSFSQYQEAFNNSFGSGTTGTFSPSITFAAGLASGLTEAILIVTPSEVCKIRLQSQKVSLSDVQVTKHKYKNVVQTAIKIIHEEGFAALYKGVVPTMLRQGCNQAVNFTTYNFAKSKILNYKETQGMKAELSSWQSLCLGGLSGGLGPLVNNPIDVVKTRMQRQVIQPGKTPKYTGLLQSCKVIAHEEGYIALWRGISPRLMRIMPGQAITFMTYEAVCSQITQKFHL
mmetsp:Transcript_164/g.241  ORF Transcript_164/g.241 Transcript_164/m.241 type:complete len:377 (-) Transcript_164:121-1251(-)|eukprot:CAMPEP_0184863770 /NCGR_PEP_ID=MMETSP0580-20130426/12378_1 /TAXON_ID=1118495 /ORGANISM="Dactyliosolen fragilissimus" /LENGTH=376 /DNA_ID=CAMNT_0027362285 /DNA_START=205 /DNA_END=1335 /DNA_ORIENTATION=+